MRFNAELDTGGDYNRTLTAAVARKKEKKKQGKNELFPRGSSRRTSSLSFIISVSRSATMGLKNSPTGASYWALC